MSEIDIMKEQINELRKKIKLLEKHVHSYCSSSGMTKSSSTTSEPLLHTNIDSPIGGITCKQVKNGKKVYVR